MLQARPAQTPRAVIGGGGSRVVEHEKLSAVLIELAHTLGTDFPIQGILDRLVASAVDVLDVTAAGVNLIPAGGTPEHVAASGRWAQELGELQARLRHGPGVTAHETGRQVSVPDLLADDAYPALGRAARAAGLAAVFTFPLRHGDVRLGALDLFRDTPGPLTAQDVAAAQTLADVSAAYLLNARGRQDERDVVHRLQHSASHDALTGLPNRVLLEQRLAQATERGRRSHGLAAVLFADVDRFKAVNDTYGHGVGDAVLVAVAQRLACVIRPTDTLARVSGDEFVILCEDLTAPSDAELLATRIQLSLAQPFSVLSVTLRVTASVGIAYAGPGELVSLAHVRDADSAMYEAKRRGGAAHRTFGTGTGTGGRRHGEQGAGRQGGVRLDATSPVGAHLLGTAGPGLVPRGVDG